MKLALATIATALLLSACTAATTSAPVRSGRYPAVTPAARPGTAMPLLGATSAELARLFGAADRELREGDALKLQYRAPGCILDAYLYADGRTGRPAVTHVDARRPDGRDADRAACVAELQQGGGRRRN